MTFHLGQKVECVSNGGPDIPDHPYPWPACVVVGGIYVVRDSGIIGNEFVWLYLEEYRAPLSPCGVEAYFSAEHFRAVVETKTDISIFTKLLTPNPQRRELVSSVVGEDINTL